MTTKTAGDAFLIGAATAVIALAVMRPVAAMPRLMDLYNEHPRALPQHRDKCVICHVNADGSGRLTPFGERYEHVGLAFSEELMREYGNLFAPVAGAAAPAQAPAEAPGSAAVAGVAASAAPGGEWVVAKYYRAECQKCHGKYGDGDPLQGVPAWANRKWIEERMPQSEELFRILMKGKDKMIGHEGKITDEQGRELLEHVKSIAVQYGS